MAIELFKERIDSIISHEGGPLIKLFSIILWALIIISFIYIFRSFGIITAVVLLIATITFIEWRLRTNKHFADKSVSLGEALQLAKTGDLLFFRSFHTYDLPELLFFRYLAACFSHTYFGHVGLIMRMNNQTYIIECTEDIRFDELSKTRKNGPIINLAEPRIQNYHGRVHLCRTNFEEYFHRNHREVAAYIESMKTKRFFEGGLGCVGYVKGLLKAAGVAHKSSSFSTLCSLLKEENYKVKAHFEPPLLIRNAWQLEHH